MIPCLICGKKLHSINCTNCKGEASSRKDLLGCCEATEESKQGDS